MDDIFWINAESRMIDAAIQREHARDANNTSTKSSYYRCSTILLSTVVEAFLYAFVSQHSKKNNNGIIKNSDDYFNKRKVPKNLFDSKNDLFLFELGVKSLNISNIKEVRFEDLIRYCSKNNILTKSNINKIRSIQKMRNRIHFQSLSYKDIGYTDSKIEKISSVIELLVDKINK